MKRLILTALSFAMVVAAKADIIRGYVVERKQEALAAANVYLKGSTTGTTTNTKGYFELDVNINAELTISYVGYKSISFKSNENKTL